MTAAMRRLWPGLAMIVAVFAADQASKAWVLGPLDLPSRGTVRLLPVLDLAMVWNHGITFGLMGGFGAWGPAVLGVAAMVVVALLVRWMARAPRPAVRLAIGAVTGGAIGNVVDRVRHGAVVDFILAHWHGWSWYVFNLADAAICVGVGVLLLDGLRPSPDAVAARSDGGVSPGA